MAQSTSAVTTVTASGISGIYLHGVASPSTTIYNFVYGNVGRTETVEVQGTALKFIGRTYPVYDAGGFESQSLKLEVLVPIGPDEQTQVQWFRDTVRNRQTICYRDSRGRKHYGIIASVEFADQRVGTVVSCNLDTVDYNEAV